MARILAQCGLVADDPAAAARRQDGHWYLWPCNAETWSIWLRLQTQWRVGGMGVITGLDYAAVWASLAAWRVRRSREVFEHLQAMERAALDVWSEQSKQR